MNWLKIWEIPRIMSKTTRLPLSDILSQITDSLHSSAITDFTQTYFWTFWHSSSSTGPSSSRPRSIASTHHCPALLSAPSSPKPAVLLPSAPNTKPYATCTCRGSCHSGPTQHSTSRRPALQAVFLQFWPVLAPLPWAFRDHSRVWDSLRWVRSVWSLLESFPV